MSDELRSWQDALAPLAAAPNSIVRRIVVLDETTSTQDECRHLAQGQPGLLVTTLRQTAGRGRLGRQWADDRGEGVALTLSVPTQPPERQSIASAIAVCEAAKHFADRRLGIRWPNDIMADGRKLAGILIEQQGDIALIGIGINVNQADWPIELTTIAVSLRQLLDQPVSRSCIIAEIIKRLGTNLARSENDLADAFRTHDILVDTTQTFIVGHQRIVGVVERIDPLRGLQVRTTHGRRTLPAATTSLIHTP